MNIKKGTTSQLIRVFIADTDYADGRGKTGLAYNTSGIKMYYLRETASSATAITPATMTVGTWASGGFKEVDATNMPGVYEVGIPDAALATGANSVILMISGMTGAAVVVKEITLVAYDAQDSVRLGLTALPNAAAAASGGLFTRGTGAGQINQNANGEIDVRVVNLSTAGAAAYLSVATGSSDLDSANSQSVAKLIVNNVPSAVGIASSVWGAGTRTLSAATNITSSGGAINVSSGVVESNLVKIDGTANASAHFQLGKLSVVNSGLFSGAAVVFNNTGGTGTSYALQLVSSSAEALLASTSGTNKPSASFNGNGSGAGIISFGGASGPGIKFDGGGSAVSIDIADGVTLTVDGKNIITLLGDMAGVLMGKSSVSGSGPYTEVFRSIDDARDVRTIVVNDTTKQRTASS